MIDLKNLTIAGAHKQLLNKDFSARELAQAHLDQIAKTNPDINAFLEVYDDVLENADKADEAIVLGTATALTGIPLGIKDNIVVKGKHISGASKILDGYIAPYDATAIQKLKKEKSVIVGRTNMDEFAMGGSTENSAFGVTKNPIDTTRVPGGSSGGSIASVAMNGVLGALGSDTGGSVRQPAAFCGVVGLKPTYGSVSRYGLMAMGSSLDVIGPVTKTVEDSELLFNAIKGRDPMDSTSIDGGTYKRRNQNGKITIGVPYHILEQEGIDQVVRDNFLASIEKLKTDGFDIVPVELPNIGYSLAVYYILMPAEVSSNLARFDGVKYGLHTDGDNLLSDYLKTRHTGFGPEVRRRILIGTYVLSTGYYDSYYNKANILRQKITNDFTEAFKTVDIILTPTTPTPAYKIGEKIDDPLAMYLADVFTVTANIVGMPAISVPSGFTQDTIPLPLGIQFVAPHNAESLLFEVGKKFFR
jgi:aspartyl-tRNA(Asn)/glutamyl-tRNA(Gln) amidotransferase subunit A